MVLQITIFDHRGCARVGKEYLGEKSNTQDDEMMVKVAQTQLNVASNAFTELANAVLAVCAVCSFSKCIVVPPGVYARFGPWFLCGFARAMREQSWTMREQPCKEAIRRATWPRLMHKWGCQSVGLGI